MRTPARIAAFAVVLLAAFGIAYGAGAAVGPVLPADPPAAAAHGAHAPDPADGNADHAPGGLQVSEGGLTLDLRTPVVTAGATAELSLAIVGADGRPVTGYQVVHDKELHLILASRDLTTFRHVHPERDAAGLWRVPVLVPRAGDYRVFADFTPTGGANTTLGADLAVSGAYAPAPLPEPLAVADVDGYRVTLSGGLRAGAPAELTLSVSRGGVPVTDLQPYLGAYGHLVALRAGDLAYLHVHPSGAPGDGTTAAGPAISFTATAPTAGTYRLFLDFRHGDVVRTAAFTVRTGPAQSGPAQSAPAESGPAQSDPAPVVTEPGEHGEPGHGH